MLYKLLPASWSSCNTFVSTVVGLRFKSRAGQIGHSVFNRLVARNSQWGGLFWESELLFLKILLLQRSKILLFFAKITKFYGYFDKKIMLLKRGLKTGRANMIKLVA